MGIWGPPSHAGRGTSTVPWGPTLALMRRSRHPKIRNNLSNFILELVFLSEVGRDGGAWGHTEIMERRALFLPPCSPMAPTMLRERRVPGTRHGGFLWLQEHRATLAQLWTSGAQRRGMKALGGRAPGSSRGQSFPVSILEADRVPPLVALPSCPTASTVHLPNSDPPPPAWQVPGEDTGPPRDPLRSTRSLDCAPHSAQALASRT